MNTEYDYHIHNIFAGSTFIPVFIFPKITILIVCLKTHQKRILNVDFVDSKCIYVLFY